MKYIKLFIVVSVFLGVISGQAHPMFRNPATPKYDYKKCIFTIKIVEWKNHVLIIKAILTNTSSDTLKYQMNTNQWIYYMVDSKSLELRDAHNDLIKSFSYMEKIPPHQSKTYELSLVEKDRRNSFKGIFRLQFQLILIDKDPLWVNKNGQIIRISEKDLKVGTHFIWSNTVRI
ncbi:MAG: hypothetical protein V4592_02710 [Bacteroidota bacterium]